MNSPEGAKTKKTHSTPSSEELTGLEKRLLQEKARAALQKRREAQRKHDAKKRKRFQEAFALSREEDALRKLKLGEAVIASGADQLDPAIVCGLLIEIAESLTPERAEFFKEQGLKCFADRKAQREAKK